MVVTEIVETAYMPFSSLARSRADLPCAPAQATTTLAPSDSRVKVRATVLSSTVQLIGVTISLPLRLVTFADTTAVSPMVSETEVDDMVIYTSLAPSSVVSSEHDASARPTRAINPARKCLLNSFILQVYVCERGLSVSKIIWRKHYLVARAFDVVATRPSGAIIPEDRRTAMLRTA